MPKILLAIDGSKHALRAAQKLVQAAAWYRDPPQVHMLYVHLPIPEVHGLHKIVNRKLIQRYYAEEGQAALAACKKLLARAKIPFEAEVVIGPAAETIVARANKTGCDTIYMGTRGQTALANMLLGSVATKVLHMAKIPVVVVR